MQRCSKDERLEVKLFIKAIMKLFVLVFSSGVSLAAGGIIATLVIALMNHSAQDGPIFPAPLVAMVVVIPVSFILFLLHSFVLVYEWITQRRLRHVLLWIGLVGGLTAGLVPYVAVVAPYQSGSDHQALLAFGTLGIIQGMIQFGFHWVFNKVKIPSSRTTVSSVFSGN